MLDYLTNKTWLWLDDNVSTIVYLKDQVIGPRMNYQLFASPATLIDYLAVLKQNKIDLGSYGLIIDVYLMGHPRIFLPKEWTGLEDMITFPTEGGYDAGLVFYESGILGLLPGMTEDEKEKVKPFWAPPPPVIFLTVMQENRPGFTERLDLLRKVWANSFNSSRIDSSTRGIKMEDARIEFVRKWDMSAKYLDELKLKWR